MGPNPQHVLRSIRELLGYKSGSIDHSHEELLGLHDLLNIFIPLLFIFHFTAFVHEVYTKKSISVSFMHVTHSSPASVRIFVSPPRHLRVWHWDKCQEE